MCRRPARARLILDTAAFVGRKEEQKAALRKIWTEQGLPGRGLPARFTVNGLDVGPRSDALGPVLKPGDAVRLQRRRQFRRGEELKPWRSERKCVWWWLRLICRSHHGQRAALHMKPSR